MALKSDGGFENRRNSFIVDSGIGFQRVDFNSQAGRLFIPHIFLDPRELVSRVNLVHRLGK